VLPGAGQVERRGLLLFEVFRRQRADRRPGLRGGVKREREQQRGRDAAEAA